jgi:hypothetical protein
MNCIQVVLEGITTCEESCVMAWFCIVIDTFVTVVVVVVVVVERTLEFPIWQTSIWHTDKATGQSYVGKLLIILM